MTVGGFGCAVRGTTYFTAALEETEVSQKKRYAFR